MWTSSQWVCLMFSEKFRFSFNSNSDPTFVRRTAEISVTTKKTSVNTTVMVVQYCSFEENYTALGSMSPELELMEDNTSPHRENIVNECLQSKDITRMEWQAFSPNLNPIEHVMNHGRDNLPLLRVEAFQEHKCARQLFNHKSNHFLINKVDKIGSMSLTTF
ncbi:transposable element Tcb2 transposase [Trichonephila clavipes]|uniref:Transposable element Tcb2 transposase n=1 Tax=Trichonephila clavipes TaxID=2585209 RepID=A0A8X6SG98_TRICX|nr:transposable element Tcb2 transposase [Trichonephila clavipes]